MERNHLAGQNEFNTLWDVQENNPHEFPMGAYSVSMLVATMVIVVTTDSLSVKNKLSTKLSPSKIKKAAVPSRTIRIIIGTFPQPP